MELGPAAGDALRSRLTLQQAERDGGTKTTAMAVFVPRRADNRSSTAVNLAMSSASQSR